MVTPPAMPPMPYQIVARIATSSGCPAWRS
jgi:hypothetical protein